MFGGVARRPGRKSLKGDIFGLWNGRCLSRGHPLGDFEMKRKEGLPDYVIFVAIVIAVIAFS